MFSYYIGLWYEELSVAYPAWNVSISVLRLELASYRWYTFSLTHWEHSSPVFSVPAANSDTSLSGCLFDRLLTEQQQQQQHQQQCCVFAVLRAGTSEPVRDGDICIFKFSTPAMCCSVCMAGHEEVHARLAAWRAVAAIIVVWDCEIKMNQ